MHYEAHNQLVFPSYTQMTYEIDPSIYYWFRMHYQYDSRNIQVVVLFQFACFHQYNLLDPQELQLELRLLGIKVFLVSSLYGSVQSIHVSEPYSCCTKAQDEQGSYPSSYSDQSQSSSGNLMGTSPFYVSEHCKSSVPHPNH